MDVLTPKRFIGIELGVRRVRAVQLLRAGGGWRAELAAERDVHAHHQDTKLARHPSDGTPGKDASKSQGAVLGGTGGLAAKEDEDTATVEALRSLLREGGFRPGAPAAVSMRPGDVFFHTLDTDLLQLDDVRRVLKFETEGDFPFPPDDLVVDICSARKLPGNRQSILAAAVSRQALERTVRTLREAGVVCVRVDAAACALHGLTSRAAPEWPPNPSGLESAATPAFVSGAPADKPDAAGGAGGRMISLHVSEDDVVLAIAEEGQLTSVHSFSPAMGGAEDLVREMELSWREVFGSRWGGTATRCMLSGDEKLIAGLPEALAKSTGLVVVAMSPFAGLTLPEGLKADSAGAAVSSRPEGFGGHSGAAELSRLEGFGGHSGAAAPLRTEGFGGHSGYAVAVGMALEAAGEIPGANFLTAEAASASAARKTRRGLIVAAVLIGAVAAMWSVGMFLKLHALTVQRAAIRSETADIAAKAFPSESPAGNASPQLVLTRVEDLLKEEKKAHSALSALAGAVPLPLQALQRIEARMPPGIRVKITELAISERAVRLAGTTDSYKNSEELRKQFESAPEFENVTFPPPERGRNSQSVPFVATFSLRPGPQNPRESPPWSPNPSAPKGTAAPERPPNPSGREGAAAPGERP